MWTLFIDCTSKEKIRLTEELRIKNKLCTALELVQKYVMQFVVYSGLSTSPVGAFPFKAGENNNMQGKSSYKEQGKRVTRNDMGKCKGTISNPTDRRPSKMIEDLQKNPLWNPCISIFFSIYVTSHKMKITRGRVRLKKERLM